MKETEKRKVDEVFGSIGYYHCEKTKKFFMHRKNGAADILFAGSHAWIGINGKFEQRHDGGPTIIYSSGELEWRDGWPSSFPPKGVQFHDRE